VTPDGRELAQGLKLAAVAVLSAILTATLVIGGGEALLRRSASPATSEVPDLLTSTAG
jgi:hypothetical protein